MKAHDFALLLKHWRSDNEFSQRDAAQVLGVNKRTLENWEQERATPQGYGLTMLVRKLKQKRVKLPLTISQPI
jgi:DNA-binding transcriptional regulator YiaG